MEASLQSYAVKNFKRILTCMTKFGEDLTIQASHDGLQLTACGASRSAFCLFTFSPDFFQKYSMTGAALQGHRPVKCKLLVKALLSVLGRGTLPVNVDRLDLKILDGEDSLRGPVGEGDGGYHWKGKRRKGRGKSAQEQSVNEADDVVQASEARLVVKLICKHGVVKTHSLNLSPANFLLAMVDPDTTTSRFVVPARALRDWSEHFAISGSSTSTAGNGTTSFNKYESELGWCFDIAHVRMKTWEGGAGGVARNGISTEIKVRVDEFEEYHVREAPIMMAFPMREFRAAFSLAESLSVPITTTFSEAGQPISIQMDIEGVRADFTIATTRNDSFIKELKPVPGTMDPPAVPMTGGKRRRADTDGEDGALRGGSTSVEISRKRPGLNFSQAPARIPTQRIPETQYDGVPNQEPLFYPAPSQSEEFRASQAEAIRASGLGLEDMAEEELMNLMEMDDDELDEGMSRDVVEAPEERGARALGDEKSNMQGRDVETMSANHGQAGGRTQIDETFMIDDEEAYDEDEDEDVGETAPMEPSAPSDKNRSYVPLFED